MNKAIGLNNLFRKNLNNHFSIFLFCKNQSQDGIFSINFNLFKKDKI